MDIEGDIIFIDSRKTFSMLMPDEPCFLFSSTGRQRGQGFGVFSVEVEEEFQPFQFRLEGCRAVAEIDGGVQCAVGVEELLRHGVGIVEIGE